MFTTLLSQSPLHHRYVYPLLPCMSSFTCMVEREKENRSPMHICVYMLHKLIAELNWAKWSPQKSVLCSTVSNTTNFLRRYFILLHHMYSIPRLGILLVSKNAHTNTDKCTHKHTHKQQPKYTNMFPLDLHKILWKKHYSLLPNHFKLNLL